MSKTLKKYALVLFNAAISLTLSSSYGVSQENIPYNYSLGPEDHLQIKVYDLRSGTGEAYQWSALNGPFIVGANSYISLPLVGDIKVNDMSPSDLASIIASRLQERVGLAQKPDASVQVIKYRPFYIVGLVEKSGEYDYRPKLTVLQAVGVAGGVRQLRGTELASLENDILNHRGEVRVYSKQILSLKIKLSRILAEADNLDKVTYNPEIISAVGDKYIASLINEENMLFETNKKYLYSQAQIIKQAKVVIQEEITALKSKDNSIERQINLAKKDLDQVNNLVSKGLTVSSRQLGAEQLTATYESARSDLQVQRLRAQQELVKADKDVSDLYDKRRSDLLKEAMEVRQKITDTSERMQTAQALVLQADLGKTSFESDNLVTSKINYSITRVKEDKSITKTVLESDFVQPGDVIKVEIVKK